MGARRASRLFAGCREGGPTAVCTGVRAPGATRLHIGVAGTLCSTVGRRAKEPFAVLFGVMADNSGDEAGSSSIELCLMSTPGHLMTVGQEP
eukprot:scaffold182183_cov27-Tisochrysis_lutea.AAC.2